MSPLTNVKKEDNNDVEEYTSSASVLFLLRPLQAFLNDPEITEICINRPGEVYCERKSVWEYHEVKEIDYMLCRSLAVAVATYAANEISDRRDKLAKINSELRSKLLDLLDLCQFADFDNGVEEFGMNEGRTKAYENISEIETYLRQLDGGINGNANKTTDGK